METQSLKIKQGLETKKQILKKARKMFAKNGFTATRFDHIGAELSMTSGVMYHHFKNKKDLYEAVVRQCHDEICIEVIKAAQQGKDDLDGILKGCMTFIEHVVSPEYCQVVLIDSVGVLGFKTWKSIDYEYSEKALVEALEAAKKNKLLINSVPTIALARLISGGTNDLALWVYGQKNKTQALDEAKKALQFIISNLNKKS